MSDYFYGINTGGAVDTVTQSGSTTSKDVEIAIVKANVPTKQDIVNAVEKLLNKIIEQPDPH